VIKRKELEAKGDKNGTQTSMSYDEIKESKERGDEANTRRSADGTWTMKRGKSYSGFKLHTKVRAKDSIIEDYEVTTASVHDSKVDLSKPKEPVIRDKAYDGVAAKGIAFNMIRAGRRHPLTDEEKEAKRIMSSIRAHVEHPYAVLRRVFRFTRVYVTTIKRVSIKALFMRVSYNLMRALFLLKKSNQRELSKNFEGEKQ
jgi:IS5 family transposase